MGRTLDGCLQKRGGYRLLYCFHGFIVSSCFSDTDMSDSLVCHNCLNIRKVQIDESRQIDQVCNALYCLLKHFVCFAESLRHSRPAVYDLQKFIIWNNDQCIHCFLQIFNSRKSIVHTGLGFKTERLCDNAYCQDSHLFGCCRDYGSRSGSGAAAHTAGDKHHISAFHDLFHIFYALLSSLLANFRLCSGAEALRYLLADLKYCWSFTQSQSLFICINAYKLHSSDGLFHHSVHSIISSSAYANDNDLGGRLGFI